ncbi:GNAT family N-acetyltransferase [Pedosphaera parvula]|nr:GNAT family protein [Pedosphaera parvula]
MSQYKNHLDQPISFPLPNWQAPPYPLREPMQGRFCRLEPLNPDLHGPSLFAACSLDLENRMWTYLPYGPFETFEAYHNWMVATYTGNDPLCFTIIDQKLHRPVGMAAYLRITPAAGSIEVGHVQFSPLLQRTPAATEAMYLMMERAFSLGYRRYEWKCDTLNAPSRAAAQRLGFQFEGIFRQAVVVKGRNRDTAWFSIIDSEWPILQQAFTRWLNPDNFDQQGNQKSRLSDFQQATG